MYSQCVTSNFTVYCKLATALCSVNFECFNKKHAKSRKPTLQIRRRPQKLRPKTIKKTRFRIFIWDICNCLHYTGHLIRFNRFHVSVTDYTAVNYKGTARISKALLSSKEFFFYTITTISDYILGYLFKWKD